MFVLLSRHIFPIQIAYIWSMRPSLCEHLGKLDQPYSALLAFQYVHTGRIRYSIDSYDSGRIIFHFVAPRGIFPQNCGLIPKINWSIINQVWPTAYFRSNIDFLLHWCYSPDNGDETDIRIKIETEVSEYRNRFYMHFSRSLNREK